MNTTLAIFFGDDYMSVAVMPNDQKFTILSSTDDKRFDLYFYTNPHTSNIEFGADYKSQFLKNSNLYFGNVIENIDNGSTFLYGTTQQSYLLFFDCIIKVVRELYVEELRKYDSSFSISDDEDIQASAIFLDNASENVRTKIKGYFRTKHIDITRTDSVDTMAVSYYTAKRGMYCENRKFAVLDALGLNLNMSIVYADKNTFTRKEFRKFPGYGIDPMVKVIAEHIVSSANHNMNLIASDDKAEYNREIRRHYMLADKVIKAFEEHPEKDTLKMNTVFACQPETKIPVTISLEKINEKAYQYSRQYAAFFDNNFLNEHKIKTSELENIILVGKSLGNNSIKQEFETFGKDRLVNFSDTDAMNFMMELFKDKEDAEDEPDDEGTQVQFPTDPEPQPVAPQPDPAPQPVNTNPLRNLKKTTVTPVTPQPQRQQYQVVPSLSLATLKPGTSVYLDTFDPAPTKGPAHQELKYQGNGQFVVLSSSRSLHFGDIATAVSMNWTTGVQLDFMVIRGGKDLGRFRTRVVVKISVK